MNYAETLTRALAITWRHRYLWLLALFAGEGGIYGLTNLPGSSGRQGSGAGPTPAVNPGQVTAWIGAHAAPLAGAAVALALLLFGVLVVSAVAGGALIRASAEHDLERPCGLGTAWRAGVRTLWPVLRMKLLAAGVTVALFGAVGSLAVGAFAGALSGHLALALGAGAAAAMLAVLAIPFWTVFMVAVLLGMRAIVLDGMRPTAALAAGFGLVGRRLGRVAVVWLLVAAAGAAGGAGIGAAVVVLGLPLGGVIAAGYAAGAASAALAAGIVGGLNLLIAVLALSAGMNAFISTFWTLAYVRLDRETQPIGAGAPLPA
jgi:hypothetical protein